MRSAHTRGCQSHPVIARAATQHVATATSATLADCSRSRSISTSSSSSASASLSSGLATGSCDSEARCSRAVVVWKRIACTAWDSSSAEAAAVDTATSQAARWAKVRGLGAGLTDAGACGELGMFLLCRTQTLMETNLPEHCA